MTSTQRRILIELLSIPTAPFAEHQVIAYIERFCLRRKHITLKRDRSGNVLVRVKAGNRKVAHPVCITAHLDHPGFVSEKMISRGQVRAFWRGGVPPEYFVGARVRFSVGDRWVQGRVTATKVGVKDGRKLVETAEIEVARDVPPGSIGMWDFPDPVIRGGKIYARACDDLAGAAAMLCAIDELASGGKSCDAYFLFTRAEEVGFIGAIAACRLGTIPKKCVVVAMETSSERPFAKIGDGPILRVGDKATTFTHEATAYVQRVAQDLERQGKFVYQRKLMDGGTCESSAYCRLGYEATGMCVALGNYHNVDAAKKRLAPEYISVFDFENVVKWFVALARSPHPYSGRDDVLDARLAKLEKSYKALLRGTVLAPK
jgi:endoglucanase